METARCPGCGATVRVGADWCSLCYRDLRPETARRAGIVRPRSAAAGDHEAGDVAAGLPFAITGESAQLAALATKSPVVGSQPLTGPASPATEPHWPCTCGTSVPLSVSTCPVCGHTFLGDLATVGTGRHRGSSGVRWPQSRRASLLLAGAVALVLAIGLPLLLTLLG